MKAKMQTRINDFLACDRIAVVGYSRNKNNPANAIYQKFLKHGFEVFAVTPNASEIQEVKAFPSLAEIPFPVEGVVVCTPPSVTLSILQQCVSLGIMQVWIHRSVDQGSYVPEAESFARKHDLSLIPFGCPMMFLRPDIFHRCMRWFFDKRGRFAVVEKYPQAG